jgi:hypothetical protein
MASPLHAVQTTKLPLLRQAVHPAILLQAFPDLSLMRLGVLGAVFCATATV